MAISLIDDLQERARSAPTAPHDMIAADAASPNTRTRRARPMFLDVMYASFLWALPIGVIAALRPNLAAASSAEVTGNLRTLPEPLYALFGAGHLGYTAARQQGKIRGVGQ